MTVFTCLAGFVHNSLTVAPRVSYSNPIWVTASDIDHSGNKPTNIVRVGTGDSSSGKQVALSSDSGQRTRLSKIAFRSPNSGAADNVSGGRIALSADRDAVLWRTSGNGVQVSIHQPLRGSPVAPL